MDQPRRDEGHGLRPIGDLIDHSKILPPRSVSNQTESSQNSKTTGLQSQAMTPARTTGPQRGATGAVELPRTVSKAMAANDSQSIELNLEACLPKRVTSSMDLKWADDFSELKGASARYPIPQEDLDEALRVLDLLHEKPTRNMLIAELTRVLLLTKSKAGEEDDMKARMNFMAEELAVFPADAIRGACREWARSNTFAPSLHDLYQLCQRKSQKRSAFRSALMRAKAV